MNYWKAERMKYRHTFMMPTAVLMPLAGIAAAAVLTAQYFVMDSYNWWYMMLAPGTIAILCGMIGEKDRRQKNRTICALPIRLGKVWDAKVLTAAGASGLSMLVLWAGTMLTAAVLGMGQEGAAAGAAGAGRWLLAAVLIWITSLWQIPLCLWLTHKLGSFVMLLVHLSACALLSAVVSLQSWFWVLPAGITPRLMCVVLRILPNGLAAKEGNLTFSPELLSPDALWAGIFSALGWLAFLWFFCRRSYERQVRRG